MLAVIFGMANRHHEDDPDALSGSTAGLSTLAGLPPSAQALQASAATARAAAQMKVQPAKSMTSPPIRGAPGTGAPLQLRRPPTTTKVESAASDPGQAAGVSQPAGRAAGVGKLGSGAFPMHGRPAAQDDEQNAPLQHGISSMDVAVQYIRSWSIQESLDQHNTLCRQKEILANVGGKRVRDRHASVQFAKVEVEDSFDRARRLSPTDAADPARTQALAAHIRRLTNDLAIATRLRRTEERYVRSQLALAEAEILKSREEMQIMKETIDDNNLAVVPDDASAAPPATGASRKYFYCTHCKVGGHGKRFSEYFLKRPGWRIYPNQKWFEDDKKNEYHCPLGKRLVDFADETHFSRLAMYIKGRVWLEDKTKMWELVPDLMPETYVIVDRAWSNGKEPPLDSDDLPWFVKEADRNWGTSVNVCRKASECMDLAKPGSTYVVQQHIRDPLCMDDGRKCHIKFYVLLMCLEDGATWRVYTFQDGYLSISPNRWSADDISKDTQVTIIRTERIASWHHWPAVYPKCKAGVAEVIKRGVAQGKLEGRTAKRQFEILSSDFVVDTNGNVWLLEFNMSPVLKDPQDSPDVHDADMITAALDIVFPWENGSQGKWDLAGEFIGEPPKAQLEEKAA